MNRLHVVLSVALFMACGGGHKAASKPVVESPSEVEPAQAALAPMLVDNAQFDHVTNGNLAAVEKFVLLRNGIANQIQANYVSPMGQIQIELLADLKFSTIGGTMVVKSGAPAPDPAAPSAPAELKSTLTRDDKGNLVVEFFNGKTTETNTSTRPVDWFIGGPCTAVLLPICAHQNDDAWSAWIFPDQSLDISAAIPLDVHDAKRTTITIRTLRYASTGKTSIVVCEGDKLLGERSGKSIVTRHDDKAVADAVKLLP
jgi:hypothetical protein